MKKIIYLSLVAFILTGCTVVRIDTTDIDNTLNVVLSKNNTLYNRVGKGYTYYVPKGVTYIDSSGLNDKLYSNGIMYYLYIDEVSYYNKIDVSYTKDNTKYYSKKIDNNGKQGYLEIVNNEGEYFIEFVYNYAKIEATVSKEDINDVILNSSYILSTIKYNKDIIKLEIDKENNQNVEDKYDVFTSKKDTDSFLKVEDKEK